MIYIKNKISLFLKKGETWIEYEPRTRKVIDYVPKEKKVTDLVPVEYQKVFKPKVAYKKRMEYVPVEVNYFFILFLLIIDSLCQ